MNEVSRLVYGNCYELRGLLKLRWINKCGSVDTLDCPPPPALPPRRPPWPPNSELSTATLRSIGVAAGSACSNNSSSSSSCSGSSTASSPGTTRRIRPSTSGKLNQPLRSQQTPPPPPSLAPPHYPAPPRPPSRNGGDEVRVARAGSGRETNGQSRILSSSRAGWSVSSVPSSSTTPSPTTSHQSSSQWKDRIPISPVSLHRNCPPIPQQSITSAQFSTIASSVSPKSSNRQVLSNTRWPERLELRGVSPLMSTNGQNTPSRPPSSASSGSSSTSNLPRVHGHDHTRPLPPPRLPDQMVQQQVSTIPLTPAPLTAPLTPLSSSSSSSFRSRVPLTSSLNDSLLSSTTRTSDRTQVGEVTLTVPRPDVERAVNEYVETPFRQPTAATTTTPPPSTTTTTTLSSQKCLKSDRRHHHHHNNHNNNQSHQQKNDTTRQQHGRRHQQTLLQSSPSGPVTKQPVSFTKEPANSIGTGTIGIRSSNDPSLSIMCDYCGKCRCESCREPPPLPSRWLCDNTCFCSAETALDYASCLCCVKGLFYHCGDNGSGGDDEVAGGSCADEPCSCTGTRKGARWACLAALTMVLPCLLCYWPLKGCVTICEACYARHAAQGCRCDPNARHHNNDNSIVVTRDSRDPEKRLLDPVTPEL